MTNQKAKGLGSDTLPKVSSCSSTPVDVPYKPPTSSLLSSSTIPTTIYLANPGYTIATTPMMITDATQPLLYDFLDESWHDPKLCGTADHLLQLLEQHVENDENDDDNAASVQPIVQSFADYPDVGQVRVPDLYNDAEVCFVLSYLTVTACLPAIQAAYRAFPEAIACSVSSTGLPLHYACQQWQLIQNNTPRKMNRHKQEAYLATVDFLLQNYRDGARQTNAAGNTP